MSLSLWLLSGAARATTGEGQLAPILITGSRVAEPADATLAAVTVIERDEIERRQATSVPDVLRGLPGVVLRSNGGLGHNTNLYLRGTNPDHVLLLIDGFAVGSASSGFLPWQGLPLDRVERLEVVRGPRSSLYGSAAIGGVVQLFTGRRTDGPPAPTARLAAGDDNRFEADLGIAGNVPGTDGAAWFDVGFGLQRTDGFNVCTDTAGCGVDQPDRDGYRSVNSALRGGWAPSKVLDLDATFLRTEGRLEFDGSAFAGNEKDTVIQVLGVTATARPSARWTATLRTGRTWDRSTIDFDGRQISRFDTTKDQLSWQNDLHLAPGQTLSVGVDALRDELDATGDYSTTRRDNVGAFGQFLGDVAGHTLQVAVRHDDNEQFGGETTGSVGWGYSISDNLRVTAGYGTAFKAPSFNDLYSPAIPFFSTGGDPDLEPETSRSAEIGLAGRHPTGSWSVNAFRTEIDDLIVYDGFPLTPQNIAEAVIRGAELSTDAALGDWQFAADLTLLDPRNDSPGPNNDNLLQRRPEQTLRLDAERRIDRLALGASLFASGRRFDDAANTERLGGYGVLDLRAAYAVDQTLELRGRIFNLFDKDYETATGYAQPGRGFLVSLIYRP